MNKTTLGLVLSLIALNPPELWAQATVTEPTGGNNVSADKALNSTSGAGFTALGNIVITEGAASDFASGANQTLFLTVPGGWQFKPGVGTVSFASKGNITAASIAVDASTATITLTVNGTDHMDTLTIGGLQVQALDGANLAAADYIRRVWGSGDTAVIAGIEYDWTTFGLVNEVAGTARALAMQTQPGATAAAGAPFSPQPAVGLVDQFGNLVNLDNTTVVNAVRAGGSGTLQGTLTTNAVWGVASFTDLSMNVAGTITLQFSATGLTSATSDPIVVGPAPADHLVFATQPGSASAGVPFGIQPVIKTQDRFGSDSTVGLAPSQPVTITLSAGSGTLSGTTTVDIGTAAGNGRATFTDLQIDLAGTGKQLTASSSGLGSAVSASFSVGGVSFSKLQVLLPGETAAPGTLLGKTGTPTPQTAGTPFNVTVNAVDDNWHLVNTIIDTVALSSSDSTASLSAATPLAAGTANLNVAFGASGSFTITASDLTDGSKPANTSAAITVSPAQFTPATGGGAIAADNAATGTFTSLTGPTYTENASGNAGTGTIILTAPAGYVFDTGGTAPKVLITRLTGSGSSSYNINGVNSGTAAALSSVSSTQLTFTVTKSSSGGVTCKLTWQNVRVRPSAGTPLAMGNLACAGTAPLTGVSPASNIGTLREVAGAASSLAIQTQPSATATAGVPFVQQPVLQVCDRFGNLRSIANGVADNTTVVSAARATGSGPLQGTLSVTASDGIATFADLSHNVANDITLAFSATGLTGATSSTISVSPAAADHLIFVTQPGSCIYGAPLSQQPVLKAQDAFGNDSTVGLGTSQMVSLALSPGTGILQGITTIDIGTAAGNGLATFSGLTVSAIGNGKQLNASSTGLASALSSTFNVNPIIVTGSITANNKIYDGTALAPIVGRTLSGALPGDDVTLSGGTAAFASKTVGSAKAVTVTGLVLSGAGAGNYQLASTSASTSADITARPLTITATAANKVYDGTVNATVTLSDDHLTGDNLSTSYASATFADKNVGTGKSINVSGISLVGADAVNYSANTAASTSADITPRRLTITPVAQNKTYDGTTGVTVTLSDDRVAGDSLSIAFTKASFADKNAGTSKPVTVTGISVTGTDAANYTANTTAGTAPTGPSGPQDNTTATTTANISPVSLTILGITAADKVYDGTTTATINASSATLSGVLKGDNVSLNTASAVGAFADKNAGAAKAVNVSRLTLTGLDAGNYALAPEPPAIANITKAGLMVTAENKTHAAGQPNPTLTASYSGFVGGETLATSGVSGSPALSTTANDLVGTYPITAGLGTLSALNYSFSFQNGVLTVTPGTASSLAIVTQPSSTAIAGVHFDHQPAVAIQDAYGNLRTGDNSTVVTVARNLGSGTLQGTLSATAANGVASFASLSHNVANTINLTFSSSGVTSTTSGSILVNPAAFTQLQLLVPGESPAPGTSTGKSGTPTAQVASTGCPVTINAVDDFWNLVNTVSDTVVLTSSDSTASLPLATALANGTTNLMVWLNTTGSFTVTANDLTDSSKTGSTSPAISVSPAQFTPATGGTAIAADGAATGTFTSLTGPTYSEKASGNVGTGTIILNAPAGFVFDTGGTKPTVLITRLSGTAKNTYNINGVANGTAVAMTAVTSSQLTFTVTRSSGSGVTCKLTWRNVRVRPTSGTVLAEANLTCTGTAKLTGAASSSNFGTLHEVAGAPSSLAILTQPSATAMAGVAFTQQPVLQVLDRFGNLRSRANGVTDSTFVTAARAAGSGTLQGTLTATAVDGVATFANLSHNVATSITLSFSASGCTGATSSPIAISPGLPTQLAFTTQPGGARAGSVFGIQPVLSTQDQFGNNTAAGLPASLPVSVSLSSGTGPLQGTTTLDIGAGNGTVAFTNLRIDTVGNNQQLTASASGLSSAVSSTFTVTAGPAANLVIQTQPPTSATAGSSFAPAPIIRLQDAFGNPALTDNSTIVTATRRIGTAALQGTTSVTAVNGLATFANLSYGKPETISIDFTTSFASMTSSSITIVPGPPSQLVVQTQPSATATAGESFAQQPVIYVTDAAGNLITGDNGRVITAARSLGTGTLQGSLSATTVGGIATFANLSHTVATTISINFAASGLTGATSDKIVVSPAAASQLMFTTQPNGVRTGSPLATQPVVVATDAFGNTSAVGLAANFNVMLTLTSGSGSLLGTTAADIGSAAGNGTAKFTNVQCSDAGANKQITASAPGLASAVGTAFFLDGVERARGGEAIPASTAGGTWTTLTGPVYYEAVSGDAGVGSIILNAPVGFVFDTASPAPTVRIDRMQGTGKPINGVTSGTSVAVTSRTSTQIRFDITRASGSGTTCSLTWQNVRVRPAAASPLASGNITKTGTSTLAGVVNSSSSFGQLTEVTAAASVVQKSPGSPGDGTTASQPSGVIADQPVAKSLELASSASPASTYQRLTGIQPVASGIKLAFSANPSSTYRIERAAALRGSDTLWTEIGSATTDADGIGEFTDPNPPSGQGYYRTVSQ